MDYTRVKLGVYVNLDPMPGTFYTADSARQIISALLDNAIPHYKPTVVIEVDNTSRNTKLFADLIAAKADLGAKLDAIRPARDELNRVLELIDQIAETR